MNGKPLALGSREMKAYTAYISFLSQGVPVGGNVKGMATPQSKMPNRRADTAAGKLVSVAGGGDTVAALNAAGATERFTYVSTAGGAFLEWMEGKSLPGVEVLRVT